MLITWAEYNRLAGQRQARIDALCHEWRRDHNKPDYWPMPDAVLHAIWDSVPYPDSRMVDPHFA